MRAICQLFTTRLIHTIVSYLRVFNVIILVHHSHRWLVGCALISVQCPRTNRWLSSGQVNLSTLSNLSTCIHNTRQNDNNSWLMSKRKRMSFKTVTLSAWQLGQPMFSFQNIMKTYTIRFEQRTVIILTSDHQW